MQHCKITDFIAFIFVSPLIIMWFVWCYYFIKVMIQDFTVPYDEQE